MYSRKKRLLLLSCMSVCMNASISAVPTGRIYVKFFGGFSWKFSRK